MADFFARVELHHAQWPEDYQTLHEELLKYGFKNEIATALGNVRLPSGLYYSIGELDDLEEATRAVKACADATGYKSHLMVMMGARWRGYLDRD